MFEEAQFSLWKKKGTTTEWAKKKEYPCAMFNWYWKHKQELMISKTYQQQ